MWSSREASVLQDREVWYTRTWNPRYYQWSGRSRCALWGDSFVVSATECVVACGCEIAGVISAVLGVFIGGR